jgi:hypothetical protein
MSAQLFVALLFAEDVLLARRLLDEERERVA